MTYRILCLAILMGSVRPVQADRITTTRVAARLSSPVYVTAPPNDTDRLFIVEQFSSATEGRIRILDLDTKRINRTPFLTIPGLATDFHDYGLLGLAFDPDYENNGYFYVNVMPTGGNRNEIRRYRASEADPNVADPASGERIMTYFQLGRDHNGGWLDFGPDGMLYVATGDGVCCHDPENVAQDITDELLGKILRLDVHGDDFPGDRTRNYAIPPDNPFVGRTGDDEIWAYGLRNPWRASFDRETGDLYMGDVGQFTREEINFQPASSSGGENYGWRLREGRIATPTGGVGGARPPGAIDPIYDYRQGDGNNEGFAAIGGYVYRGPIEALQGHYFFGDFITERIWSIRYDGSDPSTFNGRNFTDFTDWTDRLRPDAGSINEIASFGEDAAGNLYIVDRDGEVWKIVFEPTEFVRQPGDANQDGEFNSTDIIAVLGVPPRPSCPPPLCGGKYETGEPATWAEGDWDGAPNPAFTTGPPPGDGFFNSKDIVAALSAGVYETGPYLATINGTSDGVNPIPEPSSLILVMMAMLTLFAHTSPTRKRGRTTKNRRHAL